MCVCVCMCVCMQMYLCMCGTPKNVDTSINRTLSLGPKQLTLKSSNPCKKKDTLIIRTVPKCPHLGHTYMYYVSVCTVRPTNLEWCNFCGMMHFVAVVITCFWNMSPYGSTCVMHLHPPILKNGTTKQGHCSKISVSKFLPLQHSIIFSSTLCLSAYI